MFLFAESVASHKAHALPNARSLTLEEEITLDQSVFDDSLTPVDVEVCGAGAQEYREELLWWLLSAYAEDYKRGSPLHMGMSLSLREDGHVDSILLCARRRLLIIRLWHQETRSSHTEFVFERKSDLARLLYSRIDVEKQRVQVSGFQAALQVGFVATRTLSMSDEFRVDD